METSNYVQVNPSEIERMSMEIISKELAHVQLPDELETLIKRVIHTTADFEYAHLFEAHPKAVERAKEALQNGCGIYADTTMITSGVSKPALKKLGANIHCFVHDEAVVETARQRGVTRSICGIEQAALDQNYRIFVIGNAPTALVRLCELYKEGKVKPALVIGVPVGFVGAAESKEMLKASGMPYMIIRGRKGGSTVAVAILNAILYNLYQRV